MKQIVVLLAALCLSACAEDPLHRELDGMIGQNVRVLGAKLGRPSAAEKTVNGPTYTWVGGSVGEGDGPPAARRCSVVAKTDRQNVIYETSSGGNHIVCAGFAAALKR